MRAIAIVICLLTAAAVAQNPGAVTQKPFTAFEQMVIDQDKSLAAAQVKKDVEFVQRTVADDFLGIGTNGKTFDKDEVVDNAREREHNIQQFMPYDYKILQLNEDSTIVSYDCVVRMTMFDETAPRYQHISDLWIRDGASWKLKFQQATIIQWP